MQPTTAQRNDPLGVVQSTSEPPKARHHSSTLLGVEAVITLLKARRSLGITQLAKELNVSKSTAHDLAAALSSLGFVAQNEQTRRYALSPEIFRFINLIATEYGQNRAVRSYLRAQAQRLNATVVINALCDRSTYVLCASGPYADTFYLGECGPAFTGASGKALIAQRDESVWSYYAPRESDETPSPYANRDPEKLFAELRTIRATGVAWTLRERDPEMFSVAAPIRVGDEPWNQSVGLVLPYTASALGAREALVPEIKLLAAELEELMLR
jgi:DNA-binding IclR family transcriptional regulator